MINVFCALNFMQRNIELSVVCCQYLTLYYFSIKPATLVKSVDTSDTEEST